MVEAIAMNKKSIAGLLKDIKKLTDETLTSRLNFYLPPESMNIFINTLETKSSKSIAGIRVQKT
jgi:hypothetical protein